jgi:DNA-binding transcriptional LysR family regulator
LSVSPVAWPDCRHGLPVMQWNDRIGRRLKLHDLHVFMTLAETGSMGKAAELLSISQPSVSKAIGELEHTIGVRLVDRTRSGVEITPYGRELLSGAIGAFHELRQSIKDIELLTDPMAGDVQIGCPEAIACGLLVAISERFSRQHPRVVLSVHAANNMQAHFRLLRDRNVDFLIGGLPKPIAEEDLDIEVLYQDRPFVVSGAKNRWAHRRRIELAELVDEPWLLPHESIFSSLVEEAFQTQHLIRPKFGLRTYSTYQRLSLLATNNFVGAESGSVLRFNMDRFPLKVLPVDFPVRFWPIVIVKLKNQTISLVVQNFIECAREVATALTLKGAQGDLQPKYNACDSPI